ncbi:hypothetical protein K0B03_02645 [Patescibacteria group bacterium]|nr:hypothetical protein [Patescibacteria group bacterium]
MERTEDILLAEFVEDIINNLQNEPPTFSELVDFIQTKTKGTVIRRKIIEYLRRMEKAGIFKIEIGIIDPKKYLYGKIIIPKPQALSK